MNDLIGWWIVCGSLFVGLGGVSVGLAAVALCFRDDRPGNGCRGGGWRRRTDVKDWHFANRPEGVGRWPFTKKGNK